MLVYAKQQAIISTERTLARAGDSTTPVFCVIMSFKSHLLSTTASPELSISTGVYFFWSEIVLQWELGYPETSVSTEVVQCISLCPHHAKSDFTHNNSFWSYERDLFFPEKRKNLSPNLLKCYCE